MKMNCKHCAVANALQLLYINTKTTHNQRDMTANEKLTILEEILDDLPSILRIEKMKRKRSKRDISIGGNLSTSAVERLITTGDGRVSTIKRFIQGLRCEDIMAAERPYKDEGIKLKMLRVQSGIKQKDLADRIEWLEQSNLSKYELGKRQLSTKKTQEIIQTINQLKDERESKGVH